MNFTVGFLHGIPFEMWEDKKQMKHIKWHSK